MLVCKCTEGNYQVLEEIEVPKGWRQSVALRKWIEDNGVEKIHYAGIKLLVPEMRIKKVSKVEVVYA